MLVPDKITVLKQLENEHFYGQELGGAEYNKIQRHVDIARVQARGGIASLLHRVGFDHPVNEQREKTTDQRDNFAHHLKESGICPDTEKSFEYADSYFAILPKSLELAVFQVQLQNLLENPIAKLFSSHPYDLQRSLAEITKYVQKTYDFKAIGLTEDEALQMLTRETIWRVKQKIAAHLSTKGNDLDTLNLLSALEKLSQSRFTDLTPYLEPELNCISQHFSTNQESRWTLAQACFLKMSTSLDSLFEFSKYLQRLGIKPIEGPELHHFLQSSNYLEKMLNKAWECSHKNFFECVEFLVELGILPTTYFTTDQVVHRSIKAYLLSIKHGSSRNFRKNVTPYLTKHNIIAGDPDDPDFVYRQIDAYSNLCVRLQIDKDPEITEHYCKKNGDKYIQGLDD